MPTNLPDRPTWGTVRLSPGASAPGDVYRCASYGTLADPGPGYRRVNAVPYANYPAIPADRRKVALYVFTPGALIPGELPLVRES